MTPIVLQIDDGQQGQAPSLEGRTRGVRVPRRYQRKLRAEFGDANERRWFSVGLLTARSGMDWLLSRLCSGDRRWPTTARSGFLRAAGHHKSNDRRNHS